MTIRVAGVVGASSMTRADSLVRAVLTCERRAVVDERTSTRIGTALQRMAEDLVAERRRIVQLERENRDLRSQLEMLRNLKSSEARRTEASDSSNTR